MFSLIITDYRTIECSFCYIKQFLLHCTESVDIIVVDNSGTEEGKKYLEAQKFSITAQFFWKKMFIIFSY